MSIFQRPHYESDATLFLEKLKKQKPYLAQQQTKGRDLLWDKNVDAALWKEYRAGRIEQKPYVYQTGSEEQSE